jgi:hypothetical protein
MNRRNLLKTTLGTSVACLLPIRPVLPVAIFFDSGDIDTLLNRDKIFGKWICEVHTNYTTAVDENGKALYNSDSFSTNIPCGETNINKRFGWAIIKKEDAVLILDKNTFEPKKCYGKLKLREFHMTTMFFESQYSMFNKENVCIDTHYVPPQFKNRWYNNQIYKNKIISVEDYTQGLLI